MNTTVREMKESDAELIVNYFINSTSDYLIGMGADKNKLPNTKEWVLKLKTELLKPNVDKEIYYIIWEIDGKPVGHSNINKIEYGNHASMHLHIWKDVHRRTGNGLSLLRQTIPYYFENFKLNKIICEPYSQNSAPIKVLKSLGFCFVKAYETLPSKISIYQIVSMYEVGKNRFYELNF